MKFFLVALTAVSAFGAVDFQRQIRPILSDNCFHCHGPDAGTRMVNLRLDTREGAFSTRTNGRVIVPGKPAGSLLIQRISADKSFLRMPPASTHKTLTPEQIKLLRTWVEQGADWKEHWAFIAPVRPASPAVRNAAWARSPLDRFILAKLEANNLQPAPEADRRTLIRRVTLDLTGLPPTPAEVDAFVADRTPGAYEKVVDRLLASPRYGEHRGRYWLDAARYGDTQGIHIDNYREMWPYRDWVIQAFNRNLSFDRFTVEQLAGDLLPNATLDQVIASGFHRCNVTTNEGGVIPDEYAAIYAKDRADTTGAVWLGLTVGCATCHDHKFDPIAQKEFYAMTAFFRNTTQKPLDGNIPDTPPTVLVPPAADRNHWIALNAERTRLQEQLAKVEADAKPAFEKWLQAKSREIAFPVDAKARVLDLDLSDRSPIVYKGMVATGPASMPGVGWSEAEVLRFGEDGKASLPVISEIDVDVPFTIAAWVYLPKAGGRYLVASERSKTRGWEIEIATNGPAIKLLSDGKYISAKPDGEFRMKADAWHHMIFTNDGTRRRSGLALYVDGKFVPTFGVGEDAYPLRSSIKTGAPVVLGNEAKRFFKGGAIADLHVLKMRVDEQQAVLLSQWFAADNAARRPAAELSETERHALLAYYVDQQAAGAKPVITKLRTVLAERDEIAARSAVTFVMQERTDRQPVAHVLNRGQYDQPKDEVKPGVPAVLPPMSEAYPRNRLGLAKWIVDPGNPLASRVTVNRFWQEVFGTGIVKTAEDFGSQGEPPVNQELLDWLAVEFRESGWDVKKFFRMLVTSATYRQAAIATPGKLQRDPENRWLSRGPRFRMDGEMVRDYALAASGLLVGTIGGPSVKPYQPEKVWETVAMDNSNTRFYQQDHGDKLYRRSMYTFWKRSAPPASMDIFNAPSRETCTVRRERTNTPLQALVTMDDPQFVEAARALAEHALKAAKGNADREFDYMARQLLARGLEAREREIVARSYHDFLAYYDAKPDDAAKLLSVGESKADASLSKAEFAAMTMVANQMMNLDEVLVK